MTRLRCWLLGHVLANVWRQGPRGAYVEGFECTRCGKVVALD